MDENHNSCNRSPQFISDYIASEITAGRYSNGYMPDELESLIGPFRTSQLGLIPKADTFRPIQDHLNCFCDPDQAWLGGQLPLACFYPRSGPSGSLEQSECAR